MRETLLKTSPTRTHLLICLYSVVLAACTESVVDEQAPAPSFVSGGYVLPQPIDALVASQAEDGFTDHESVDAGHLNMMTDAQPAYDAGDSGADTGPQDGSPSVKGDALPIDADIGFDDPADVDLVDAAPLWESPEEPAPLRCDGSNDAVSACRWVADCLASQGCLTASSLAGHRHVESFCHERFNPVEISALCSRIDCSILANATPYCHSLN